MELMRKMKDKWQRNLCIYKDAYRKGKIAGWDYTWLLWKVHTKFLLRQRNPKDRQRVFGRMNRFWESFLDVVRHYEDMPIYPKGEENAPTTPATIWLYWNNPSDMPQMVRSCISLIRKNSNGCSVVVVSEDTVGDYLQLDDVVWEKYRAGKISRTHFSDIVRIALLYHYGGVWMDCTMLLTRPLPSVVVTSDFYTNRLGVKDDVNVCAGRWSTFFMACHRHNLMMRATLDIFVEYWKRYDDIVDYVWMDYIFNLLYDHIPSVREMLDAVPCNNPDIWILQTMIAKPFSKERFDAFFSDASRFLYKLSYKDSVRAPYRDALGNKTLMGWVCSM